MKILFLRDYLGQSGSVSNIFDLLKGLRKMNHKVQIITWGGFRTEEFLKNNIPVKRVKQVHFPVRFSQRFSRVAEIARSFQPDIIQAESENMFRMGYKLSSMVGAHIVFMIHQFLPRKKFLSRNKMNRVKIVTVSQALREYLVNTVKLEKEQISVLRNGLDIDTFPIREAASGKSTLVVGMCDNYLPGRGHECFLQACRLLVDKGKDAHFFVCGYGEGEERVKKIVRNLKISEHVTFVYEFEDIRKVMSLYDIFVLPSKREGLGYRALEAMAMGIPVIASSVGGLMDVVRDEETGLLFKPGDPEKMADKIEYFLDNPDEMQRMGNRGKELIQSTFSVDKMVEGILKIYESFK